MVLRVLSEIENKNGKNIKKYVKYLNFGGILSQLFS